MFYIACYIFSILLFYIVIFRKFFQKFFTQVWIVLLNDAELRWWGGLITMVCEVYLFLWIPYRFVKFTHEEVNKYSEPSIYPFDTYLTKDLFFRDTNFSFFHADNFERMNYFYEKNFSRPAPDAWISIPYSFIEYIFIFPWTLHFYGFHITKSNLFRSLSHLSWDNSLPPGKRKHILFGIVIYWTLLCLIPFVPHFLLISFYLFWKNGDIGYSYYKKSIQNPFIWICENNIKWRKWNRYIFWSQEYIFQVESYDENNIYGKGKIILQKNIVSESHFPFVWDYGFGLQVISSNHFTIVWWTNVHFSMVPWTHFVHEIPFEFQLPITWSIEILRQSCIQNTQLVLSFTTSPFRLLPETNLAIQKDHWHFSRKEFNKNFHLTYSIIPDLAPLRMTYRAILSPRIIQISFQKPLRIGGEFVFYFDGKHIWYNQIDYHEENKVIVFHLLQDIPYYPLSERGKTLKVHISSLEDEAWCIHYKDTPRVIWFPWVNIWDN